ncbi:MAG: hypothetical protein KDC05_14850 [Bacteroidales bacterium]|nr:hypothetical protein [Bacteroidales bacterium]
MKTLFNTPIAIYLVAGIACLAIMIIIDYFMGAEAEHLNAWIIINRLFGIETGISDSLAIRNLGLFGATMLMLAANLIFGSALILLVKTIIHFIHPNI